MQTRLISSLSLTVALAMVTTIAAQQPDLAQILKFKPIQSGVVYDTPSDEQQDKCKVDLLTDDQRGWIVRDHRNLVIRKFVDSNNDNRVDRWSYYMNGQEVYRDVDTDNDAKADEFRWYHSAGSRFGIDKNADGMIDEWKSISPNEVAAEVVAALADGNVERLRPLLLTAESARQVGLPPEAAEKVSQAQQKSLPAFQQVVRALAGKVQFNRFDGHSPMTIPSEELSASQDLLLYLNGTIMVDVDNETRWLRVPEMVKVGEVWMLSDLPLPIDPNKALATAGVLVDGIPDVVEGVPDQPSAPGVEPGNEEVQEFVESLRKLDAAMPADAKDKDLASYHVKRAELCARIGSKMAKLANREHWYRQVADSLNAAVQTGEYPKGVEMLSQYAEQFGKVDWGKTLAAYFLYRAINADYGIQINDPEKQGEVGKVQEWFIAQLKEYLDKYPDAPDAADALWQLGNSAEFTAGEDDAKTFYQQLVTKYPDSAFASKAKGALKRLSSMGQPLRLAGNSLGRSPVDTSEQRGKVVLISFWATWCDPCVAEMDRLARLREKYAKAGFEVVGVCLDNEKQKAQAFLQSKGYSWPQIFEEGSMESRPAVELGIISLPYLVLLDVDGNVINKNLQFGDLEAEMEKVMTAKVASSKGK